MILASLSSHLKMKLLFVAPLSFLAAGVGLTALPRFHSWDCDKDSYPHSATNQSSKFEEMPAPDQVIIPEGESLEKVGIPMLRVAKLYEEYTGSRAIMTREIAGAEISLSMRGPLTKQEAGRFLRLILLGEGIAIIPIPDEDNIVRFVSSAPITSFGPVATIFYADDSELPEGNGLVVFRMDFKHLNPKNALKIFQAEVGKLSDSGAITAVPNESSLIITEKTSLIRQLCKIQERIDVKSSSANQEK